MYLVLREQNSYLKLLEVVYIQGPTGGSDNLVSCNGASIHYEGFFQLKL